MKIKNILDLPSPCHIIDLNKIDQNLKILDNLRNNTNLTLLYSLKGFSNKNILKHFINHFDGISASSLWEARLGKELTSMPVHIFSSSYNANNFHSICKYCDYIVFNSVNQYIQYCQTALDENCYCGIRINPEYSEIEKFSLNPCHYASRFGVLTDDLKKINFSKITGIHFHSMCEQYSNTFLNTVNSIEDRFGNYLYQVNWLNIGGGQLFCDDDYNLQDAIDIINRLQNKFNLKVIAEPCETILLDAGYFLATVVDIVYNEIATAILDASAICHLPDIVHSPYRCDILNAEKPNIKQYTYRIAGSTCYAGDIFGDYSFDYPLKSGSKIIFCDTATYSMVKSNIFNGIQLPSHATIDETQLYTLEKSYDYKTFLALI